MIQADCPIVQGYGVDIDIITCAHFDAGTGFNQGGSNIDVISC